MQPSDKRSEAFADERRPAAKAPAKGYRRRTRLKGERGYVLIMSALLMLPLLAFAGFAVDIGYWYTHANRMQRAADAASLAGVVWMPNDEKAETIALETAKANGFDDADPDIVVTVTPIGNRRLKVYIHDLSVDMYLSSLFLDQVDIERQALAEYVQAVPMGSPDNTLGNDPLRWNVSGYQRPFYWLNVSGPGGRKANGDRHSTGVCDAFSGCSGTTNLEYSDDGYMYRVNVDTKPATGDLSVQVYDPAFFFTGDTCDTGNLLDPADTTTSPTYTQQVNTLVAQGHPEAATAVVSSVTVPGRFNRGNNQFCPGDQDINGRTVDTTYIVRGPDNTPFENLDNPVICAMTFGDYNEEVYPLLNQADGYMDGAIGPENMAFDDHFRQWTTICNVPWGTVAVGDYIVQVRTNASQASPPSSLVNADASITHGGYNRFAMRAGFGTPSSGTYASGVNLFADGRLPIYVNQSVGGTPTNFYLARVVPEYAGQLLELEFFDVADGSDGTLTVTPPSDMTGSGIAGCTFIRDAAPPTVTTSTTCKSPTLTSTNYNGRVVTVQIPLPDNYSCNAGSDVGCWFRVNLDFAGGNPADTTTWSARVRGDPVRLVE